MPRSRKAFGPDTMKRTILLAALAAALLPANAANGEPSDRTWVTDGGVIVLERHGKDAPRAPPPTPAAPANSGDAKAAEAEARRNLKSLYVAEKAYFQERDRYSDDLAEIGFVPEACADGTKPATQGRRSASGCYFVYKVVLAGRGPDSRFVGYAYGAAPVVKGVEYQIFSDGEQAGTPKRVEQIR